MSPATRTSKRVDPNDPIAQYIIKSPDPWAIPSSRELPYAEDAHAAGRFACEEADALGHGYVGVERPLLGLLRASQQVSPRTSSAASRPSIRRHAANQMLAGTSYTPSRPPGDAPSSRHTSTYL